MFDWIERGSYLGIVLFLTLTGIGLPVPEEVPIVAAGVASRLQQLRWYYALPASRAGQEGQAPARRSPSRCLHRHAPGSWLRPGRGGDP
ncbi:MAG: hypothetical protein ACKOK8_13675 [Planctomycetia bacterium]